MIFLLRFRLSPPCTCNRMKTSRFGCFELEIRFLTACHCSPDPGHQLRHGAELGLAGDLRRRRCDGAQAGELLRSAAGRAVRRSAPHAPSGSRAPRSQAFASAPRPPGGVRRASRCESSATGEGRGLVPLGRGPGPGPGPRPLWVSPGQPRETDGLAPADTAGGRHRDVDFTGAGVNFGSACCPAFLFPRTAGGVWLRWGPGRAWWSGGSRCCWAVGTRGTEDQWQTRTRTRWAWEGGGPWDREGRWARALGEDSALAVCTWAWCVRCTRDCECECV